MILAVALLNKTIAKSSHYYWSPLVTYWFMVKKGRRGKCPLFNEVWPRRALCLYFCVTVVRVCEWCSKLSICSISDGLRDVISHSVLVLIKWPSRHGSPTKASPSPPQCTESDRPIRAGCCDMQSAVITALRRQDFWGGGTIHRQSPNKIHLQTNTLNHGPWRSCLLWRRHILISPLHVAPAIKRSEQWYQQRDEYKLQHPEGSRHISYADRLTVQYYSLLEIFITCHTLHALLCYNPAQVCIHCERHVTDEYES